MNSELIGILGATMLAGVLGVLWFSRLSGKRLEPDLEHDGAGHHPGDVAQPARSNNAYQMKLGTPDFAPKSASPTQADELPQNRGEHDDQVAAEDHDAVGEAPDCQAAAMNLSIAEKLQVIGDFEGVEEIAALVLESASASQRQKAQAQSLCRLTS